MDTKQKSWQPFEFQMVIWVEVKCDLDSFCCHKKCLIEDHAGYSGFSGSQSTLPEGFSQVCQ